jgi:hypothetical protein
MPVVTRSYWKPSTHLGHNTIGLHNDYRVFNARTEDEEGYLQVSLILPDSLSLLKPGRIRENWPWYSCRPTEHQIGCSVRSESGRQLYDLQDMQ